MELLRLFLPVMFPSWRFFAEIGASPRIEFLHGDTWHAATGRPGSVTLAQMLLRLFWNPDWNEKLFLVSTAERFLLEPEDTRLLAEIRSRLVRRHGLEAPPPIRLILVTEMGMDMVFERHDV